MWSVWKFFLEKRQFTVLVILGFCLWGTIAAFRITKESTPEIQIPVGVVSIVLPGASPEDVERLVTNKVEERLANLSDLSKLTSSSREGLSIVTVEFTANADLTRSIQKLKDEVDKVVPDLPTDAKTPVVSDVNFVDQPIQLISVSGDLPPAQFAKLGEDIKRELQTVPGVNRAEVSGVRNREIQVVVRKEELARLGISLSDVVSAIAASNASLPVGSITVDDISYAIDFRGSLDDVSDIGGIAILQVGGQVIYLRDIADVSDGVEKATSYSRISLAGEPSRQAMTLSVLKVRGYDITTVTAAVKKRLAELQMPGALLDGSDVVVSYDAGDEVQKNLSELTRTGLETVFLVMLSLFATIGWRESVVAGLSIPLSFLIAFVGLWYSGNTFNIVSLFSLILAIGILVDSGIVIVEAIHTRTRIFGDKERAALESLHEYAWPLIGGTMTTVAVFAPLFFISGIVGKFIASIPFTLIFVLIASIFVALGLVPTLANMFSVREETELTQKQEEYAERARQWYAAHLGSFLRNRKAQNRFFSGMFIAFIIALSLPVVGLMKVSFFPTDDSDFLYVDIEKPAGTDLNATDLATRAVEEALYGDPRFESLVTTVGSQSMFSDSTGMGPQSDPRFANITINFVKKRSQSSSEILQDVKEKLAPLHVAEIRAAEPSGGPPVGAAVLVKYSGLDRDLLSETVSQARDALEKTKGATTVDTSNKFSGTQYSLSIDRGKLAALGLSPSAVAAVLRTAISGVAATKLTGGEKDVDIVVSLNLNPNFADPHDASRTTIDSLRQIPLKTPSGNIVLLGSVVKEGISRSDAMIAHENRERVLTLSSDVLPGYTAGEVLAAFHKAFPSDKLPPGITESVGGENEETNKSFAEMGYALIAGLALMFIILVLAFNNFRFTFYLLSIVPLSLIGVFGGLTLALQPLSFPSMMGVIALAGVIINHAIILMDAIIKRIRTGAGRPFSDIIVEAAVTRLRPIVLTTITTVIGMVPLTFASALFGPLALAILFGLTFAMILTLVLIPTLVYRWPGKLPAEIVRD
jgi:multidrug efflux pump subunit AcrB